MHSYFVPLPNIILGDPGAGSRDDAIFSSENWCTLVFRPKRWRRSKLIASSRLAASGAARMAQRISYDQINSHIKFAWKFLCFASVELIKPFSPPSSRFVSKRKHHLHFPSSFSRLATSGSTGMAQHISFNQLQFSCKVCREFSFLCKCRRSMNLKSRLFLDPLADLFQNASVIFIFQNWFFQNLK